MRNVLLLGIILLLVSLPVWAQANDPCATRMATKLAVSQAATGPLTIITKATGKHVYICSIFLLSATQQNINLIESAETNCGTPTAGLLGGVTAATGPNMTAAQWFNFGNGSRTITQTATAGDNVCLISSSTGQISGVIMYVQR